MTYCVGMLLDDGMVFVSDSRTNAGVDRVASFQKMHVFQQTGKRVFVLLTSGNLSLSQSVVALLHEGLGTRDPKRDLYAAKTMFAAARIVGGAMRETYNSEGEALKQHNVDFNIALIFGGQIKGSAPGLYQLYDAGNFVAATEDTPYFQVGEVKYGKPVLDRVITRRTSLVHAAKAALISFDSTMRSNVSVGPPIDVAIYRRDAQKIDFRRRLGENDPYLIQIRKLWGEALLRTFTDVIPDPDWKL